MTEQHSDLTKIIPPKELDESQRLAVFDRIFCMLAAHRSKAELCAQTEYILSQKPETERGKTKNAQISAINSWAAALLRNVWAACGEPGQGPCPTLSPLSDSSTAGLPDLPDQARVNQLLNTILFLHLTTTKGYHAHTRTFLAAVGHVDEDTIAAALKNPDSAIKEAEAKTQSAKEQHAKRGKTLRRVGIGLAAVGGGVLVGVTGGLAAPLVGAGATAVLGWLGVGGTAAGLLASGLAGSSVVCGALFGAYGSRKSAQMVGRYTQEVRDLSIVPVHKPRETLAVRLCISGWLDAPEDVTAPWTVFSGDDTFALQWEVEALMQLSNALRDLIKDSAFQFAKGKIIQQTVFASLAAALSPLLILKIGRIIDNPWMTAKALASKAGRVLGTLLAQRVLGNRPVTLVGYSLGSLVISEALQYLASLPPAETTGLVQDVYLFGSPTSVDANSCASARRVVSGRLVNGYSTSDYILAVLARLSDVKWAVAGLQPISVPGVEDIEYTDVDGHLKWRGMIGRSLQMCNASGIVDEEVHRQLETRNKKIDEEMKIAEEHAQKLAEDEPELNLPD